MEGGGGGRGRGGIRCPNRQHQQLHHLLSVSEMSGEGMGGGGGGWGGEGGERGKQICDWRTTLALWYYCCVELVRQSLPRKAGRDWL